MITIDYQSKRPLYEQITQRFQALILRGVMKPDTQMPSVRTLAVEVSINSNTTQKADSLVEQQGYIYPVKGRGNFVSDSSALVQQKKDSLLDEFKRLVTGGKELGIRKAEYIQVIDRVYQKEESHD